MLWILLVLFFISLVLLLGFTKDTYYRTCPNCKECLVEVYDIGCDYQYTISDKPCHKCGKCVSIFNF